MSDKYDLRLRLRRQRLPVWLSILLSCVPRATTSSDWLEEARDTGHYKPQLTRLETVEVTQLQVIDKLTLNWRHGFIPICARFFK